MKVGFFNKKLWKQYSVLVSAFAGLASLVLAFIDISQKTRITIGFIFIATLVGIYMICLFVANLKNKQQLKINNTEIRILYGDIFQQDGLKVIAFNEYFDTQVDDVIISKSSLNGQFIASKVSNVNEIDTGIKENSHLNALVIERNAVRPRGGKLIKYKLGTCYKYRDYLLLAFSHFDEENCAYLSVEDYVTCLIQMWHEIDIVYNGRPIVVPLLGSGITRLKSELTPQELLKEIIWTYKASNVKFYNATLTIVLPEIIRKDINLFDIGEE